MTQETVTEITTDKSMAGLAEILRERGVAVGQVIEFDADPEFYRGRGVITYRAATKDDALDVADFMLSLGYRSEFLHCIWRILGRGVVRQSEIWEIVITHP